MATKAELIQSIAKSPKEPLPDENSEAVCQEDVSRKNGSPNHVLGRASSFATSAAKGNPNSEKSIKPLVATSSFCSHGASNDPIYYSKRKYQDSEESAYLSENVEEPEEVIKTVLARGNTRCQERPNCRSA
ncbi:hypothetical protein L1049_005360 [Liquidambar formosana]|uniref:Uncharacterized protein n=1 Tax=Liquidambar formosana TaxID=63359 RepID=A0AAP0WXL4_LIQFO